MRKVKERYKQYAPGRMILSQSVDVATVDGNIETLTHGSYEIQSGRGEDEYIIVTDRDSIVVSELELDILKQEYGAEFALGGVRESVKESTEEEEENDILAVTETVQINDEYELEPGDKIRVIEN